MEVLHGEPGRGVATPFIFFMNSIALRIPPGHFPAPQSERTALVAVGPWFRVCAEMDRLFDMPGQFWSPPPGIDMEVEPVARVWNLALTEMHVMRLGSGSD